MTLRMDDPARMVTDHGGSLARAEALFPGAPTPWLDLSTGISPYSYPVPALPASAFQRLPEETELQALMVAAAQTYGAPEAAKVVAAPGTQILLPQVMALAPHGKVAVLSPTYAEYRRAAALAGHAVSEVTEFAALYDADIAIVVNPNNPDGRIARRSDLLQLAEHLRAKDGLLVVDEAFMDVGPVSESICSDVDAEGIVVLRSFGKFFGLAGLRLGFAIAAKPVAEKLRATLGPWTISGPALGTGLKALNDTAWQTTMRTTLVGEAARLDTLLAENGLPVKGGTSLFRFLRTPKTQSLFQALGKTGILVRPFDYDPNALRIGLPGTDAEFERLAEALRRWRKVEAE